MLTQRVISAPNTAESLVEILRQRAAATPEGLACRFLGDRDAEDVLTYAELDARARAIASTLQAGCARGERALLLYPPGVDYVAAFFGCLYAGVVAVPAYPPNGKTLPRLLAVVADAGARVGLTTREIAALVPALDPGSGMRWIATDGLDVAASAPAWRDPGIDRATLAFLQYTSGSTGAPKGVMLTHGNLLRNEELISERFGLTSASHGMNWLPPYHDMGLIGGILQPIYRGFPGTMMSPLAFVKSPLRWLRAISRLRATCAGGPNFGYEMCLSARITPELCEGLDLSSWDLAFVGAEPTRADTLERFAAKYAPYGFRMEAFYHCYGLAESTLIVSGGEKIEAPIVRSFAAETAKRRLVSAGRLGLGERVEIVDPDTRVTCPPGVAGEIWVQGRSVAAGYWGNPELSGETFQATTAAGEGPFLRTGDLGFVGDGELFICGRLKDVIIIDGLNHHPHDLEHTVERSHAAVRRGGVAAFAIGDEAERAAVICEVEGASPADHAAILRAVRAAAAEVHGIGLAEIRLVPRGTVPKTTSGKIQRRASRAALLEGKLPVVASWSSEAA